MKVPVTGRVLLAGSCIPLAFVVAAEFARVSLSGAPLSIASDLAQPLPVATTWHDFGGNLFLTLLAAVIVAGIAYGMVLRDIATHLCNTHARAVLVSVGLLGALSIAAAMTFPVVFSSDVYAYGAYGQMAARGINPYSHQLLALSDPLTRAAIWQWGNPPPLCVYGPAFVWLAKAITSTLAPSGAVSQLLGLRILSGLSLVACGQLIFWALDKQPVSRRLLAAAGLSLNPVALWCASEGHNDALMLLIVLCGFIMLRRFGLTIGSFVIAASALVKAPGVAAGMVLAAFAWPVRSNFVKVAAGMCGGIIFTAMIARPFEAGISNVLIPRGHYTPQYSAQYLFSDFAGQLLQGHAHTLEFGVAVALVASGALLLFGLRSIVSGKAEGAAFMALALWLAIPNPYPWYALWILPVAFVSFGSSASLAVIAASLAVFARYFPDVAAANNADLNLVVTLCEIALPMLLLLPRAHAQIRNATLGRVERAS
ncbi:MAG: hypothetical protein GIW98_06270 [Candidatus Eremiobacteraeota bacterium]|nr:hypothetical protein [Candidatus Eremiobacteraeota bacterium]